MTTHEANGSTVCIHSVVVRHDQRRRSIGRWIVTNFVREVSRERRQTERFALLSKPHNARLYERAGFMSLGDSPVDHGAETWIEMQQKACHYGLPIVCIDAFAEDRFKGNPAAVVVEPRNHPEPDSWRQNVAMEMSLSETAFVQCKRDGTWSLRWFTPSGEIDLCGHGTLATAAVLWQEGHLPESQDTIRFETMSGNVSAVLVSPRTAFGSAPTGADALPGSGLVVQLDFPARPPEADPSLPRETVRRSFGLGEEDILYLGRNTRDCLVEVTPEAFRRLCPAMDVIREIPCTGVTITAADPTNEFDFVSRFFAPRCDVPEDPVTGSSFSALGPFWAEKIGETAPTKWLQGRQCSARGGVVGVRVELEGRVSIRGRAVSSWRGFLSA